MLMSMDNVGLPFRPVQGTENKIKSLSPTNGYVYFATDTKKIYCGKDSEFIPMGGNSGIYYGKRPISEDEKYGDEVLFTFSLAEEHIEGDQVPVVDDLILNLPDGGFYRVLDVSEDEIYTRRLAIAGGGGGGPSSGNDNEGKLEIRFISPQRDQTLSSDPYIIEFEIVAKDSAGDVVYTEGTGVWRINGKEYSQTVRHGRNTFEVTNYLKSDIEENTCTLTVKMDTGGSTESISSKKWYIKSINLDLKWERAYTEGNFVKDTSFTLSWTPYGNVDCVAHIIFDNNMEPGVTYFTKNISAAETGKSTSLTMPSLPYGVHTAEMYLTADINGRTEQTKPIKHDIMFVRGGTSTLLMVPYYAKTATQYDTLNIQFMVYNPTHETRKVSFYVNDEKVSTDEYGRGLQNWPYTLTEHGAVKLSIRTDDGDDYKDIELTVSEMQLNLQEVTDYKFSLHALKFSSNDEVRRWNSNGVTAEFSDNFDWINGGLKFEVLEDGSIEKYICVRQGTTMTINYNLFKDFNSTDTGGKLFKFCFKAVNCYDYEAPVLSCYEEASKVGIVLDAQKAKLSTLTNQNFTTQYYENSYIELEAEIWPNVADISSKIPGDRFLMFWVDGIPAGVKAYDTSTKFLHPSTNLKSITIGSDSCDVYVYCAKVYERRLDENEHLNNFIADAPSANKMIDRYNRNDILDNKGEISFEKLVKKNPECHAYMYEVPYMTTSKDDKDNEDLKKCNYTELYKDNNTLDNPYYTADNVSIYVQGTSSAAYGVAAFNLRSDFKKSTLKDKNGNVVSGWSVSDTAWPIKLPCTKVNVASCENCNNVVNQEWYNKFQPYHDAHRRKVGEKLYRDTMEFNSGVLFIKDNNTNTNYLADDGSPSRDKYLNANAFADTVGYVQSPYYKQYAISNMGNDKKNIEVFHDVQNPKACCVEVLDNQNAEHWMTIYNENAFKEIKVNGEDVGPFYEFRYSVKDCKAEDKQGVTTASQEADFLRLVRWMSECNPNAATDEPLNTSVTYTPKTFRRFDSSTLSYTTSEEGNPSGVSLVGCTVSDYAGTYTTDSKEYRIAKMLDECEDYLVMDSIMYHYLFIERHTMVDNVAKNTFWSTEDGIHWDLTKDYDNDTADGNDNSGYLSFTYGMEFGDLDSTGGQVFNAKNSVWINFAHALTEAQQNLYKKLEQKGAWDSEPYLEECKRHQNSIPERCWIYDYFRKYIRPRRLGLDEDTYLKRLEGGKKTHQREQYEKYQEFYINSKYVAGEICNDSSAINLRLNCLADTWNIENILPISYYIDCYSSLKAGGQLHRSPERVRRKSKYNVPIGRILNNPDDGTCYIYGSGMIQTFEGLPDVYPNEADFNPAKKLKVLQLGKESTAENPYYNSQLSSVNISSANMLQDVQIQNCGPTGDNDLGMLSMPNTYQLQSLKINGSTFTGLTLAKGSVVETLHLNDLSSIKLEDLAHINEVTVEDGIYSKITDLTIINCPALNELSYALAKRPSILNYQLNDIEWTITSLSDLTISDGKVVKINVLENLKNKLPNTNSSTTALTGKIIINVNCTVDEFDLYKEYSVIYPNLLIEYSDAVTGLNPAVELVFKSDDSSTSEVHYRVLGSGDATGDSIATLISADGPLKVAMTVPSKEPTASHIYTFTKYWINKNDGKKYYVPGSFTQDDIIVDGAMSFADIIPTTNMEFYPEYESIDRTYTVKFVDWDGTVINQEVGDGTTVNAWNVIYNTAYNGPIKNYYYRDSSNLNSNVRWDFMGWSPYKYGDNTEIKNPTYINPVGYIVTGNVTLFAHYVQRDCTKYTFDEKYFDEYFNFSDVTLYEEKGLCIHINDSYRNILKGKITLPAKYNGKNIIQIGDFKNTPYITHLFCINGSTYKKVGGNSNEGFFCSNNNSSLQKVVLPNTVLSIGDFAFLDCIRLEDINLPDSLESIGERAFGINEATRRTMSIKITSLPTNLRELSPYAFYNGGDGVQFEILPAGLITIPRYSLFKCPNLKVQEIGTEHSGKSVKSIGTGAFGQSGFSVNTLTLGAGIESISAGGISSTLAFVDYGKNASNKSLILGKKVNQYINSENGQPLESMAQVGFSSDWAISEP